MVLRPDLIDYETNQQFDIVVIAHDLVLPENQRRQVRFGDSLMVNHNAWSFLCCDKAVASLYHLYRVQLTLF